jgi:hypothetical protein
VVAPENYYDAASSLVDRARVVQKELVFDVFKHKREKLVFHVGHCRRMIKITE